MDTIHKKIEEAVQLIAGRINEKPDIAIILGTGLGGLVDLIEVHQALPYKEIPNFPHPTVEGHAGKLIFGQYAGKKILVMQGRVHIYEGYTPAQVTFPLRVMKKLGIQILMISNAAGGLDPLLRPGDVMVISDHINLMGQNPLIGPNLDAFGPRFPGMIDVYDKRLIALAQEVALEAGIKLSKGVYAGVTGPSLETPAETRFLRTMGADAVGMSTVPEVIVAIHSGLRVLGFSAISNINLPDWMKSVSLEEILVNAASAGKKLTRILQGVLERI